MTQGSKIVEFTGYKDGIQRYVDAQAVVLIDRNTLTDPHCTTIATSIGQILSVKEMPAEVYAKILIAREQLPESIADDGSIAVEGASE